MIAHTCACLFWWQRRRVSAGKALQEPTIKHNHILGAPQTCTQHIYTIYIYIYIVQMVTHILATVCLYVLVCVCVYNTHNMFRGPMSSGVSCYATLSQNSQPTTLSCDLRNKLQLYINIILFTVAYICCCSLNTKIWFRMANISANDFKLLTTEILFKVLFHKSYFTKASMRKTK